MNKPVGVLGVCLAVGSTGLVLAACGGAPGGVARAVPTPLPTATLKGPACVTARATLRPPRPAHGLVTVDGDPVGVTAVWVPGLNQRPCRTAVRHYPAVVARRLAGDIRQAPRFPRGNVGCPNDDGSAVDLYFAYAHRATEYVAVGLRGCTSVDAPGRSSRRASGALMRDLASVAPQPWASAIRQFAG